jgi:two-component system nitrogen regulation sensor histidine kinase NtrY
VLAFLFVALVPLGLLAAFGPRIVRGHFQNLARERVSGVLGAVSRDLASRKESVRLQISNLADDPVLVRFLALPGPEGVPQLPLIDYTVERRAALGLDWLEVTDADGTVLARGHDRGSFGLALAEDPLVGAALTGQAMAAVTPLAAPDSGLALLAAAPIAFERQVLGSVRGGTLLDQDFVDRGRALTGADLAVLPSSGRTTASTFAGGPPASDSGETVVAGIPYRVGSIPLVGTSGQSVARLAVGVSEADFERTLESLLRLLGAAALIGLLVAIGVALLFADRISRPVRALALASQRVAQGDLRVRLPAGPNDEVGDLMAAFNQMTLDLAGTRERLVRGERHAAWSQVARRLAHEIKNPLTPIQLAIEEVERARVRGVADFEEVLARAARTIKTEVRELRELVREFSDFARGPAPRPEPVDLHELLDRGVDLYVPSSIEVQRDYAPAASHLTADPDLLARSLGNLIKNACEAMEGQGRLVLETRRVEDEVIVTVRDSGPGIPAEDRDRVFTPYFTTKAEGTGLGLAIVQRVIEAHGGSLDLARPDQGAAFVVRLPADATVEPDATRGPDGEERLG